MSKEQLLIISNAIPLVVALIFALNALWQRRSMNRSHYFLAVFFFCFITVQFFSIATNFLPTRQGIFLIPLLVAAGISIPPTMYLYINALTIGGDTDRFRRHYIIPAILFVANLIGFSLLMVTTEGTALFEIVFLGVQIFSLGGLGVLFPVMSTYYLFQAFALLKGHNRDIGDLYSYDKGINLRWTRVFIWGFLLYVILITLSSVVDSYSDDRLLLPDVLFDFVTLIYVSFVGVKSAQQNAIYRVLSDRMDAQPQEKEAEQEERNEEWMESLREQLTQFMADKKPYTDTSLSIYDVAAGVGTNYKYLSRVINGSFKMNFATYINQYRVEEAKRLLTDKAYDNYTIEALAEMSGFKSKSAFNTAFKKFTGQTPSQFKQGA